MVLPQREGRQLKASGGLNDLVWTGGTKQLVWRFKVLNGGISKAQA